MARAKYETRVCRCRYRIVVRWEYCPYERMGVPVSFHDGNDAILAWSLPIDNCPKCGVELIADELENI